MMETLYKLISVRSHYYWGFYTTLKLAEEAKARLINKLHDNSGIHRPHPSEFTVVEICLNKDLF